MERAIQTNDIEAFQYEIRRWTHRHNDRALHILIRRLIYHKRWTMLKIVLREKPQQQDLVAAILLITYQDVDTFQDLLAEGVIAFQHIAQTLFFLLQNEHWGTIEALVQIGLDVDGHYGLFYTTFLERMVGHPTQVRWLLLHGADPNITSAYYITPLITASRQGHRETMKLLLDAGAHTDMTSAAGQTALDMAHGFREAQLLLMAGAHRVGRVGRAQSWFARLQ